MEGTIYILSFESLSLVSHLRVIFASSVLRNHRVSSYFYCTWPSLLSSVPLPSSLFSAHFNWKLFFLPVHKCLLEQDNTVGERTWRRWKRHLPVFTCWHVTRDITRLLAHVTWLYVPGDDEPSCCTCILLLSLVPPAPGRWHCATCWGMSDVLDESRRQRSRRRGCQSFLFSRP